MFRALLYLVFVFASFQLKASDPVDEIKSLLEKSNNQEGKEQLGTLVQANSLLYNRLYDIDSLTRVILKKSEDLNEIDIYLNALNKFAWVSNYLGFYNYTDSVYQNAYQKLIENGDSVLLADILLNTAVSKRRQLKYSEAENDLDRAGRIYKVVADPVKIGRWNLAYASLKSSQNDDKEALSHLQKSLSVSDSLEDYISQSKGFILLSSLGPALGHSTQKRTENLEKALLACDLGNNCLEKGIVLMNLSSLATRSGEFEKALKYIDLVIENDVCQGKSHFYSEKVLSIRRGMVLFKKGDYRQSVLEYLKYYKFLEWQLDEQNLNYESVPLKHLKNYPSALLPIAECYFKLGQLDSADYYSKKALEATNLLKYKSGYASALFLKSKIAKQNGDFGQALHAFEQATALKDSLQEVQKFKSIKELETKYNTNQVIKENEILAKEKELTEAKAMQTYIVLLLVVLMSIGTGVVWWYVVRQKRQKELYLKLEIEQRFLRSQLNPHFIFNSLGAIQNFILNNNASEAGNYLSRFSRLMRSILENSREEYISLEEEIETLNSYLELQRIRNVDQFNFKLHCSPSVETEFINIPPMLLQPIVENAIEHGFKGINYPGLIEIEIEEISGWLKVSIKDNGKGRIAASKTAFAQYKNKSLSTTITSERLTILNQGLDEKIEVGITDLENPSGTLVVVRFPNDLS